MQAGLLRRTPEEHVASAVPPGCMEIIPGPAQVGDPVGDAVRAGYAFSRLDCRGRVDGRGRRRREGCRSGSRDARGRGCRSRRGTGRGHGRGRRGGRVNRCGGRGCRRRRGHAGRKRARRQFGDRGGRSDRRSVRWSKVDRGSDDRAADRGSDHGTICNRAGHRRARHLEVDGTEPDDQEDRAALVGLENRVDARLEPRRDQGLDARDRQFLVLRDRADR